MSRLFLPDNQLRIPRLFHGGYPGCCPGPCACCNSSCGTGIPDNFQVVIAGWANGTPPPALACLNCAGINGTYVVPYDPVFWQQPCRWHQTFGIADETPCWYNSSPFEILILLRPPPVAPAGKCNIYIVTSSYIRWGYAENATYELDQASPITCKAISGLNIPIVTNGTDCIAGTCTLTAI